MPRCARSFRFLWPLALGATSCALVFPYGDYQAADGDAAVGGKPKGGNAGVSDASFGGGNGGSGGSGGTLVSGGTSGTGGGAAGGGGVAATGGLAGAGGSAGSGSGGIGGLGGLGGIAGLGGVAGLGGAGATGGAGGTTGGGGSGGTNPCGNDGTPCGPAPSCTDGVTQSYWQCSGGVCNNVTQSCAPNKCSGGVCIDCATCADRVQSGSTKTVCPGDTQTLLGNLSVCCNQKCSSYCSSFAACGGSGAWSTMCMQCLMQVSNGCYTEFVACMGDKAE